MARDARVRHAKTLRDGAHLHRRCATVDEQLLGRFGGSALGPPQDSGGRGWKTCPQSTLTCLGKGFTLTPQGNSAIGGFLHAHDHDTLREVASTARSRRRSGAELTQPIIQSESHPDHPGYDKTSRACLSEIDLIAVRGRLRRPEGRKVCMSSSGSLDDRRRAGQMNDLARAVITAGHHAPSPEDPMRVGCIVVEMPGGALGVGLGPLRLRDLAACFGVQPGDERSNAPRFDHQ